jgi:hypothetical protein
MLEHGATVAALAGALWAGSFLIPRAVRQQDPLALACSIAFAAIALGLWLLVGVAVRAL